MIIIFLQFFLTLSWPIFELLDRVLEVLCTVTIRFTILPIFNIAYSIFILSKNRVKYYLFFKECIKKLSRLFLPDNRLKLSNVNDTSLGNIPRIFNGSITGLPIIVNRNLPYVKTIDGTHFLLDTGSPVNIVSVHYVRYLTEIGINLTYFETTTRLKDVNGNPLNTGKGVIIPFIASDYNGRERKFRLKCIIENDRDINIIGYPTIAGLETDRTNVGLIIDYSQQKVSSKQLNSILLYPSVGSNRTKITSHVTSGDVPFDVYIGKYEHCNTCTHSHSPELLCNYKEKAKLYLVNGPCHENSFEGFIRANDYYSNFDNDFGVSCMLGTIVPEPLLNVTSHIALEHEKDIDKHSMFLNIFDKTGSCLTCNVDCNCSKRLQLRKNCVTTYFQVKGNCINVILSNEMDYKYTSVINEILQCLRKKNVTNILIKNEQDSELFYGIVNMLQKLGKTRINIVLVNNKVKPTVTNSTGPAGSTVNQNVNFVNTHSDIINSVVNNDESLKSERDFKQYAASYTELPNDIIDNKSVRCHIKNHKDQDTSKRRFKENSNPSTHSFIDLLIETYNNVCPKNLFDLGRLHNPRYILDLELKDNIEQLPFHKPFPCSVNLRKASARIFEIWKKMKLICDSDIRTHSSRVLVVRKHLSPNNYNKIRAHLKDNYNITLSELDQSELNKVDPDYLSDEQVLSTYRCVVDARSINMATKPHIVIAQNPYHSILDLFNIVSGNSGNTDNLQVKSQEDILDKRTDENWMPEPLSPAQQENLDKYFNDSKIDDNEIHKYHFSVLDLKSAHNSIGLTERAQSYLNICGPNGEFFKFLNSPFGLQQISSAFNSSVMHCLHDLILRQLILPYADDILLISYGTQREHLLLVNEVVKRFSQNNYRINLSKSSLLIENFDYLGFQICDNKITITKERVSGILNFPEPTCVKNVQSFCGILQYVSIFYHNLALDLSPLTDLLRKGQKFIWGEKERKAFENIKDKINNNLELHIPQRGEQLYLYTDSSMRGGGAVLLSGIDKDSARPVMFFSKKYPPHIVSSYTSLEKEALIILYSINKIYYMLQTNTITLLTDAKVLTYLVGAKALGSSGRLNRIALRLAGLPIQIQIQYTRPSISHLKSADWLSRSWDVDNQNTVTVNNKFLKKIKPSDINLPLHDGQILSLNDLRDIFNENIHLTPFTIKSNDNYSFVEQGNIHSIHVNHGVSFDEIINVQRSDEKLKDIIMQIEVNNETIDGYDIYNGVLCEISNGKRKIIIPKTFLPELIVRFHIKYNHVGMTALNNIISNTFASPNISKTINTIIGSCNVCLRCNHSNFRKIPLHVPNIELDVMSVLAIDHFSMKKSGRFTTIFICVDLFSTFTFLFPVPDESAKHVIDSLETIFKFCGPPTTILSDNSRSLLKNKNVQKFLERWGVYKSVLSLPYNPTHNASCERRIRDVRHVIRKVQMVYDKEKWNDLLPLVAFILNSTEKVHSDGKTKMLLSPFEKFHLRVSPMNENRYLSRMKTDNKLYIENLKELVNKTILNKKKDYIDKHNVTARVRDLKENDLVIYRDLMPPQAGGTPLKYKPPFQNRLYMLKSLNGKKACVLDLLTHVETDVSVDFLKKYKIQTDVIDNVDDSLKNEIGYNMSFDELFNNRQNLLKFLSSNKFDTDIVNDDLPVRTRTKKQTEPSGSHMSEKSSLLQDTASVHGKSSLSTTVVSDDQPPLTNMTADKDNIASPSTKGGNKVTDIANNGAQQQNTSNDKDDNNSSIKEKVQSFGRQLRNRLTLKRPEILTYDSKNK